MLNLKAGKETQLLQHNIPRRVFCFLCFTVFCHFLRLHRLHCSTVANFASPFHLSLSLSGVKAGNPEQARWAHLAHPVSPSEHRICFIFPTGAASDIITCIKTSSSSFSPSPFLSGWYIPVVVPRLHLRSHGIAPLSCLQVEHLL